jgi:hypothetical protein
MTVFGKNFSAIGIQPDRGPPKRGKKGTDKENLLYCSYSPYISNDKSGQTSNNRRL